MEKIHIMADSGCDLTKEIVKKHCIEILPLIITSDAQIYEDFYDLETEEYLRGLEALSAIPTVSQVTPVKFLKSFISAYKRGCTHVLCVTMSSTAGGTYESAKTAEALFREEYGFKMQIEIIDSRAFSLMYGIAVEEAAKMRESGAPFDEILNAAKRALENVEALFFVYTPKYLKNAGVAAGFTGEAMGMRPILRCRDGAVEIVGSGREDEKVMECMTGLLKRLAYRPETQEGCVVYASATDSELEKAESAFRAAGFGRLARRAIGCSTASKTGPYVIGLVYRGNA